MARIAKSQSVLNSCGPKTRASFRNCTRKRRTPKEIAMQTNANAQRDLDTLDCPEPRLYRVSAEGGCEASRGDFGLRLHVLDSRRQAARQGRVSQADGAAGDDQRACGRGRANPLAG